MILLLPISLLFLKLVTASTGEKVDFTDSQVLKTENGEIQILMKLKADAKGKKTKSKLSNKIYMEVDRINLVALSATPNEIKEYQKDEGIQYIEFDREVKALYLRNSDNISERNLKEERPWGVSAILQDKFFWEDLKQNFTSIPSNIKICTADTGYDYYHEDLPKEPHVTGSNNKRYNEDWWFDGYGHGTHVAGTVAALGNNEKGVEGIFPNDSNGYFQLVIAKALRKTGTGTIAGVIDAVETCIKNGAKVISLSLGHGSDNKAEREYYKDIYNNHDALLFAAAGNDGDSSFTYPASYPELISIAAIDSGFKKASFSNKNKQVELSGPGVRVSSTIPGNKYASWSGTSMATPHAAGAGALVWMYFPECSNVQIRNTLAATALDLDKDGCDSDTGYGLVQPMDAFLRLEEGDCGGYNDHSSSKGGCGQVNLQLEEEDEDDSCENELDCNDFDPCTIDTCFMDGSCKHEVYCELCQKVGEFTVKLDEINRQDQIDWEILDINQSHLVMQGEVSKSDYRKSTCLEPGMYKFIMKYNGEMKKQSHLSSLTLSLDNQVIQFESGAFMNEMQDGIVFQVLGKV